jgi:hypothetical protein
MTSKLRSEIDHTVIASPFLDAQVKYVYESLGVMPLFGGVHTRMGTHNYLLRLGNSTYLEVIVLDVPNNASIILYGALLRGTGQIWFDNLNFEIVTPAITTTGIEMETSNSESMSHQKEPLNLEFEK